MQQPTIKLTWTTTTPVWVDQWPLKQDRLHIINDLIDQQLKAGHKSMEHSHFYDSEKIRKMETAARFVSSQ